MKKVISSTLLSALVIPGAGQINNRDYLKGGAIISAVLGAFAGFTIKIARDAAQILGATHQGEITPALATQLATQVQQQNAGIIRLLGLFLIVIWIYGMVDALVCGKKIDERRP
jgi:hypothetical protein